MAIVYSLVILLVLLIIYTMISTIIKLSLYLTTGTKYENVRLIIPVILTLLTWTIVISLYILTLNKYFERNIFAEFMETYILKESLIPLLKPIIFFGILCLLIGSILQALTYFSVNIKLENIFSYIRYYIFKLFKIKLKAKPQNIIEKEQIEELYLGKAFLASMLSTTMITFSITIFIIIGLTIANKFNIM